MTTAVRADRRLCRRRVDRRRSHRLWPARRAAVLTRSWRLRIHAACSGTAISNRANRPGDADSHRRGSDCARRRRRRAGGDRHRRRQGGTGGGFGRRALGPWGEASSSSSCANRRQAPSSNGTGAGRTTSSSRCIRRSADGRRRPPDFPFLGSSRLEPIGPPCIVVFLGTRIGASSRARRRPACPVYNVSMPLLTRSFADRPPYRVLTSRGDSAR